MDFEGVEIEGEIIGKIKKSDTRYLLVVKDIFRGKAGVTIREFAKSDGYTGFTKSGTRISADLWDEFRWIVEKVSFKK